jgi:hypothetical protein
LSNHTFWQTLLVERPETLDLPPLERRLARLFVEAVERHLFRAVPDPPPLAVLAVHNVLSGMILALRAEQEALSPTDDAATRPRTRAAASAPADTAGRAREHLRKAMRELETLMARMGEGDDGSLSGAVRPLLDKTEGVLDEALRADSPEDAPPGVAEVR